MSKIKECNTLLFILLFIDKKLLFDSVWIIEFS